MTTARTTVFRHAEAVGQVRFAVTGRDGGVSRPPYDRLNLGGHVGDDREAVDENRRRVAAAAGQPPDRVLFMNQVHGADVAVVTGPWTSAPPPADAMVTGTPGLVLAVLVADCVPVVLADPAARLVAVAHAGRQGLVAGVVPAVLAAMEKLGARRIIARIGPSICGGCYEVPADMRDDVAAVVPTARSVTRRATPAVDVAAGVVTQLRARGVDPVLLPGCTVEDPALFSYRRDRTTGRFAALAWLESS